AYQQSITDVLKTVHVTEPQGLSTVEAQKRLAQYGKNEIGRARERASGWNIFLGQWKNPLILILVTAGAVSGLLGEMIDMGIIVGTAILNVCIGFAQEYKANRSMEHLRSMVPSFAHVRRDGQTVRIETAD